MIGQMLARAAPPLGAHRDHRRGARGRRVLGRLHLRRRRPAPALRPGLRRHRPRGRGVRRRRVPVRDGGASSRAPAGRARPLHSGAASGLGVAFAAMALAPSAEVEFAAIVRVGRVVLHAAQHAAGPRHADGARGARRRPGAVRALPVRGPGDRRADRRAHRRPLGRAAGVLGSGDLPAAARLLVLGRDRPAPLNSPATPGTDRAPRASSPLRP